MESQNKYKRNANRIWENKRNKYNSRIQPNRYKRQRESSKKQIIVKTQK